MVLSTSPNLEDPNFLKLRSLDSSCPCFLSDTTILTHMMADEFIYIAEADADLIPVPRQLELYGRFICGVLLSPCFGAPFSSQI